MTYYYWFETEYHYGDYSVPKFALIRGRRGDDGIKERDTEEVILWAAYEDVPGYTGSSDSLETDCEAINAYIEKELGFLPDYEIN